MKISSNSAPCPDQRAGCEGDAFCYPHTAPTVPAPCIYTPPCLFEMTADCRLKNCLLPLTRRTAVPLCASASASAFFQLIIIACVEISGRQSVGHIGLSGIIIYIEQGGIFQEINGSNFYLGDIQTRPPFEISKKRLGILRLD
jgi:hypothetical protein